MLEFKIIQCPEKQQLGMYLHFNDELFIGNSEGDMIVDDPNMAPRQARIFFENAKPVIENVSEDIDIKINTKPLNPGESQALGPKDTITLGKTLVQFTKFKQGAPDAPAQYQHPQHESRFAIDTKESAILKSLEILEQEVAGQTANATPPKPPSPPPLPRGK